MKIDLKTVFKTTDNTCAGVIRLILGGMFVMTGMMKLIVPSLGIAFAGQLQSASIPFQAFNMWFVPCFEIFIGSILLVGVLTRLAALVAIGLMTVATYVHLIVDDPALFPLQPDLPTIPILVIILSIYLLVFGAGSWSRDLKNS